MTYLSLLFILAAAIYAIWHYRRGRDKSSVQQVDKEVVSSTAAAIQASTSASIATRDEISSLGQFDQLLREEYVRFVEMFPEKPIDFVQRRFSRLGIFPRLGWRLIEFGESAALSKNDPELLIGTLYRFQKCAHACWGHADERGLHSSGYDFCTLVVPALYSSLLGKSYISAAFPSTRKMSKASYPGYMHAANIMVCIEHKLWPHAEKSKDRARSFVAAKSTRKVDKSFVEYFLGILDGDGEAAARALVDFNKGYERSDWGKYKPGTRSTFTHSLAAYAGYHMDSSAIKRVLQDLFSDQQLELWERFHQLCDSLDDSYQLFQAPLDFLNDMSFYVIPADDL